MHVPATSKVIVVPLALQTSGVVVENVTTNPDDAVALTVTGDCASVLFDNAVNLIVCVFLTTIDCCTGGAAT